jgi:hypothetical protein
MKESCPLTIFRIDIGGKLTPTHKITNTYGPPLLFIHGAHYQTPMDAYTEICLPLIEAVGEEQIFCHRTLFLVWWNSQIVLRDQSPLILHDASSLVILWHFIVGMLQCRSIISALEERASHAAKALHGAISNYQEKCAEPVAAITHSMGASVWLETLTLQVRAPTRPFKPGIWWSIQPAIPRKSFCKGQKYEFVPHLYNTEPHSKIVVWYSKFDLVLTTVYFIAKRCLAMGQSGCPQRSVPHKNLTFQLFEAHGRTYLLKRFGPMVDRMKSKVLPELKALGIIP